MTAVLSPAEQGEVTRFGVHDEDVIAGMEARFDDELTCIDCDSAADWRRSIRCCGDTAYACARHEFQWKLDLTIALRLNVEPICAHCGHHFPRGVKVVDIVREVRL
ncbi:hypothetical protein [Microbacterium sp.]|uniref:hypothetical protein n=1 Tax=Microbacterium sp. TaxID=51671 RepID=UPI0039E5186B